MYGADPEFTKKFREGDLIVASTNFGCGSSREHAAITLKSIGVAAVLAESFGRIFYRNAINLGLPVITCKGIHEFAREGDVLRVNIRTGKIRNETTQQEIQADPFSDYIMHILESGGIKPMIRAQQQAKHAK
jgi:3-isopropylmalate/(R)-2-methylmalate dehydratase small subunit